VKALLLAGLVSAVALWAPAALPCGMPFGAGVSADPDQDILLAFKGGIETYDFQPTFCGGAAADFGVILPVPAALSSQPSRGAAGAFTAVNTLTQPKIVQQTACEGDQGLGDEDAGAGSFGTGGGGPTIVAGGRVGFLDWTQLKADSPASFTTWLDANGYPYDSAATDAFSYYVNKGWYFVAFKISAGAAIDGGNGCVALGPVKLAFPTPSPVVPSRIAAAGATAPGSSSSFLWNIYGITDATTQLAFDGSTYDYQQEEVQYAEALSSESAAQLDSLAAPGDRLAKLAVVFDGTSTDDVALTVSSPSDYQPTIAQVTYVTCGTAASKGSGCSTSGRTGTGLSALGVVLGSLALVLARRRRIAR
jgi:hypothetical protein